MKARLFYLIGVPGAGKSTLMREVLKGERFVSFTHPFEHSLYQLEPGKRIIEKGKQVVELGAAGKGGGPFPGTDRLSMAVQPKAVDFLWHNDFRFYCAEGDRLANAKFFDRVKAMDIELTVCALSLPPEEAARRRAERARVQGLKPQNAQWVAGRESKMLKLLANYCRDEWVLDAMLPVEELAAKVKLHPVFSTAYLQ